MPVTRYLDTGSVIEVTPTAGLPVSMSTGLNASDDSVLCYPATNTARALTPISSTIATISGNAAAVLAGIFVNTALGSAPAVVKDGTTVVMTIPTTYAAGTQIDCHETAFANGLNITSASVAGGCTGALTIFWRPL